MFKFLKKKKQDVEVKDVPKNGTKDPMNDTALIMLDAAVSKEELERAKAEAKLKAEEVARCAKAATRKIERNQDKV
jgi:hypothetical protein